MLHPLPLSACPALDTQPRLFNTALVSIHNGPGVVCLTPMARLLALWSGAMYASQLARRPVKWPLALGACLGGTFVAVGLGVTGAEHVQRLADTAADGPKSVRE